MNNNVENDGNDGDDDDHDEGNHASDGADDNPASQWGLIGAKPTSPWL